MVRGVLDPSWARPVRVWRDVLGTGQQITAVFIRFYRTVVFSERVFSHGWRGKPADARE